MNTPPEYDKKKNAQRLREGLRGHVDMVAARGRERYPSLKGLEDIKELIADPEIVRFPTVLVFAGDEVRPEGAVKLHRDDDCTEESYIIELHKGLAERAEDAVMLALYVIVNINYGKIAKDEEACSFASAILGMDKDDYADRVRELIAEFK